MEKEHEDGMRKEWGDEDGDEEGMGGMRMGMRTRMGMRMRMGR